jgi:predicted nucleic acid-binding protein
MAKPVILDAGPLGMVSHPKAEAENKRAAAWLKSLLAAGTQVIVPEIADYEIRRELLRAGKQKSIQRLDHLKRTLTYLPISTDAMLKAAEFWADARNREQPTAKDEALDGDVILAAQAHTFPGMPDKPIIATTNLKHLLQYADADVWDHIS